MKKVIKKIKTFFSPGTYIVPESIENWTRRFYNVGLISLGFGILVSITGKSIRGIFCGLLLLILFYLMGKLSYLSITKNGYNTFKCKCVDVVYTKFSETKAKITSNNDEEGKRIKKLFFQEAPANSDENILESIFAPPIIIPYDPRFEMVEKGSVVNIYTTKQGKIMNLNNSRIIDPIIGVEIIYSKSEENQKDIKKTGEL